VIDLCASVFDWATYRRTKGAVKLQPPAGSRRLPALLRGDHRGRRHEVTVARTLTFPPGTILVLDRGYVDFAWFAELTRQGVFFVTRLKDNAVYAVLGTRDVPRRGPVVRDELITLTGVRTAARCPYPLRVVEVTDPTSGDPLVFLTNQLTFGSTTIARIYKDRWQIELLFKALNNT